MASRSWPLQTTTSFGGMTVVVPLQPTSAVGSHLLYRAFELFSPPRRDTPHTFGSRPPVRLGIPGFLLSKVSQKIAALPNCMPQFPLTGVGGVDPPPDGGVDPPPPATEADAEQLAVVPLLEPLQFHVHGPEPATDDAVPAEQRLVEGLDDAV